MTRKNIQPAPWPITAVLLCLLTLSGGTVFGQCDFINDITGLSLTTPPAGNAANPSLYTQRYVLVNNQGVIYNSATTPDFLGVPAGNYDLFAINFDIVETPVVLPLLTPGSLWSAVVAYGDLTSNCLDYSSAYGTGGCPIVVCEQRSVCETDVVTQASTGAQGGIHTQTYCLVCNDIVQAIDAGGVFDLSLIPAAVTGANCQIFGVNYRTVDGIPMAVSNTWSGSVANMVCTDARCVDYITMDLDITATPCGPLPVVLEDFSGRIEGQANVLSWSTSNEQNLATFELERAQPGGQFSPITSLLPEGAGTVYTHLDEGHESTTWQYRLRTLDQNGAVNFSEIVTLERTNVDPFSHLDIYPNPTSGTLHFDFTSSVEGAGRYEISDLMGRKVFTRSFEIAYGENQRTLDLEPLPAASYVVSFFVEEQVVRRVVVKE